MSSVTVTQAPATRMKAEDRRELILAAAAAVFGERGYVGATTDAVAKAADISQPYVVRMFGTKAALFRAVLERSLDKLIVEFRQEIADFTPESGELHTCIGRRYAELLSDRGLLLSLMQAFMLGADPEIGPTARAGFMRVYRLLRDEGHFAPEEATEFLAGGMMLNTMVGLRMGVDFDTDPFVREMLTAVTPHKVMILRDLARD